MWNIEERRKSQVNLTAACIKKVLNFLQFILYRGLFFTKQSRNWDLLAYLLMLLRGSSQLTTNYTTLIMIWKIFKLIDVNVNLLNWSLVDKMALSNSFYICNFYGAWENFHLNLEIPQLMPYSMFSQLSRDKHYIRSCLYFPNSRESWDVKIYPK